MRRQTDAEVERAERSRGFRERVSDTGSVEDPPKQLARAIAHGLISRAESDARIQGQFEAAARLRALEELNDDK